jgi:hypothetical protein
MSEEKMSLEDYQIIKTKTLRVALDEQLQEVKLLRDVLGRGDAGRQASIAVTDLESTIMRLGMVLKEIGNPSPYPNSYNPNNTVVDPTADNLKL